MNRFCFRPKIYKVATLLMLLCVATYAQGISKKCIDELIAAKRKSNSDLQDFSKDLVTEVVKVKAQLKLPFGKPADSKVTDIGITVGCLKAFPENPAQIVPILKEAGLYAVNAVANKLGASSQPQGTSVQTQVQTAAPPSPFPGLKECDALFNPEKKFCYDGGVYNKCDGIVYNPETHDCKDNALFTIPKKCDAELYNSATHGCKNGVVFMLPQCSGTIYDPATHGCKNDVVFMLPQCGGTIYDPATHGCKNGAVFMLLQCKRTIYDPATHRCYNGIVLKR